jgi:hypothetical protein
MTKEEAINVLNDYDINFERNTAEEIAEAHEIAIKALEQESCEDCCNGNQTEKAKLCQKSYIAGMEHNCENEEIIKLSKDGQPSEDWNAVLDELNRIGRNAFKDDTDYDNLFDFISNLPSATPQPKTAHWEWVQYDANPNIGNWHCSECSCILRGETNKGPVRLPKYCPECGTKMQEEQQ